MNFITDLFKTSSSSSNTIDPQIKQILMQNYNTASGVANAPFQPYTGERVAPFTQTGLEGQQSLIDAARNPTGTNTINQAGGILSGVAGYQPQSLKTTNISDYANPYTNDVVNATLGDLSHAYGETKVADNAAATAAHAFGGTRQAVQRANTTDDYLRNVASTSANLRSGAFDRAQNAAQYDIGAGLQGAGLRLNAGNSLSSLGDAQLKDALTRAGVIQQVGNQQQVLGQAQDDAAYQEFLRMINYPREQQDIRNSALGFLPKDNTQTTTNSPSPLQMIGQGASLAALALPFLSDERTKENITTAGHDSEGRRWVDYNYKGDDPANRYRGVLAQEVKKTDPKAVFKIPGTKLFGVDYAQLGAR